MTKHFPVRHISNMHFHHWNTNGSDTVAHGHTCVRVTAGIEYDSIAMSLLKIVDKLSFHIGMEIGKI